MNDSIVLALRPSAHSAGIGRTGTFIVIDILIDIIREFSVYGRKVLVKIACGRKLSIKVFSQKSRPETSTFSMFAQKQK